MFEKIKKHLSKAVTTESVLSLGGMLWTVGSFAIGIITAMITWVEGNLPSIGFAGYVAISLVITSICLLLIHQLKKLRTNHSAPTEVTEIVHGSGGGGIDKRINLEAACGIVEAMIGPNYKDIARNYLVQWGADGSVRFWGARVIKKGTATEYGEYTASMQFDVPTLANLQFVDGEDSDIDTGMHGQVYARDIRDEQLYGKVRVSLSELLMAMLRA